jgi:hypothetical protein
MEKEGTAEGIKTLPPKPADIKFPLVLFSAQRQILLHG